VSSVYTVNHLETVPPVLNRVVHDIFLGSLWKQLVQYQYEGEQQELMEKVHKAIVEFDVDFLQEV
jgi:hypothetical protein